MKMSEDELTLLCGHMGHSLNIHVDHYTLQTDMLIKTKVAKILAAVMQGNIEKKDSRTEIDDVSVQEIDVIDQGMIIIVKIEVSSIFGDIANTMRQYLRFRL